MFDIVIAKKLRLLQISDRMRLLIETELEMFDIGWYYVLVLFLCSFNYFSTDINECKTPGKYDAQAMYNNTHGS